MKMINLAEETVEVADLINFAQQGPVLLLTADGQEFLLAEADDFDQEVEALRTSQAFQRFLEVRSASKQRIPLDEIEREIEQELASQRQLDAA